MLFTLPANDKTQNPSQDAAYKNTTSTLEPPPLHPRGRKAIRKLNPRDPVYPYATPNVVC